MSWQPIPAHILDAATRAEILRAALDGRLQVRNGEVNVTHPNDFPMEVCKEARDLVRDGLLQFNGDHLELTDAGLREVR